MFGIGMPELMLIFVLALLVFGPKELPKIARTLGRAMSELRRASDELRDGIQREIDLAGREEETPPPHPEGVPSTTLAEGTPSPSETQPTQPTPGGPTEASGAPSGTIAAEGPAGALPSALEGEASPIAATEIPETTVALAPPETGEGKGSPEKPKGLPPQAETASPAPAQPVETRNA